MSNHYSEGEHLDGEKLHAIDINCRRVLNAAWPYADSRKIEAALDVLRPYIGWLATSGNYNYSENQGVGFRLREIFYSGPEDPGHQQVGGNVD